MLTVHAGHILPHREQGTGIARALATYPKIQFFDEPNGIQFRVVLRRPTYVCEARLPITPGVTPEVTLQVTPEVDRPAQEIAG